MNSFFKILFGVIGLTTAFRANALQIYSIYQGACERQIGIPIKIDTRYLYLLNLSGEVKKIRPFEIVSLSVYSSEDFPLQKPAVIRDVPSFQVFTLQGRNEVEILRGWPIEYGKDQVSFLSPNGHEVVIRRRSIYGITQNESELEIQNKAASKAIRFVHPYQFRDCADSEGANATSLYPDQTLSAPTAIKRELDQLRAGYDVVTRYTREERFYAKPEVYANYTTLGLWNSLASRYGASQNRTNNLLPFLVDNYSSDIFEFQRTFVTGSAPLFLASHEEPQAQFYYGMKASYFHMRAFFDPNLILVGSRYNWAADDFNGKNDARANDSGLVEFGFDFGHWATSFRPSNVLQTGFYVNGKVYKSNVNAPGLGLRYENPNWSLEGFYGAGTNSDDSMTTKDSFWRLNFDLTAYANWNFQLSLIGRSLRLDGPSANVKADSQTAAIYVGRHFWQTYLAQIFVSTEKMALASPGDSRDDLYPKGGAAFSLEF